MMEECINMCILATEESGRYEKQTLRCKTKSLDFKNFSPHFQHDWAAVSSASSANGLEEGLAPSVDADEVGSVEEGAEIAFVVTIVAAVAFSRSEETKQTLSELDEIT